MKHRIQYTPEFKAKAVIEALREEGTVNEIAAKYGINPVMLGRLKTEFLERASGVFKKGSARWKSLSSSAAELFGLSVVEGVMFAELTNVVTQMYDSACHRGRDQGAVPDSDQRIFGQPR